MSYRPGYGLILMVMVSFLVSVLHVLTAVVGLKPGTPPFVAALTVVMFCAFTVTFREIKAIAAAEESDA